MPLDPNPTPAPPQPTGGLSEAVSLKAENIQLKAQLDQLVTAGKAAAVDSAITQSLSGFDLHPGAASQIAALMRNDATVHQDGAQWVVCGPGMTPIADHVKATLARPEYQHFLRGDAAPAPAAPAGPQPSAVADRQALAEKGLAAWVDAHAAQQRAATQADPRRDMSQPFGLPRPAYRTPGQQDAGRLDSSRGRYRGP